MIPLSKILFFVLLIILLVLVALLITSLSGGFGRDNNQNLSKYKNLNSNSYYPLKNYNYSGGRQKSLKYNRNQKYGGNRDEYKIYPISKFYADRHCNIIRGCADVLKDIEFRKLGAKYSVNADAVGSYSAYKLIPNIIAYTTAIQLASHTLKVAITALGSGGGSLAGHIDTLEHKMDALANTADDLLITAINPIRHDITGLNTENAGVIKNDADLIAAIAANIVKFNNDINDYIEKLTDAMISIEHALNDTFINKIVYGGIPDEIITLHQNIYTFYNTVNTETNALLGHIKNAKICNDNKVIDALIAYGGVNPIECAYTGFQVMPADMSAEYAALAVAATACHATIVPADKISVTTAAIRAIPLSSLTPLVHANAQAYTGAIAAAATVDDIKHAVYNANPTSALYAEAAEAAAAVDNNTLLTSIATEIARYNAILLIAGADAIATLNAGLQEIITNAAADAASVAAAIAAFVVGNPGSVAVNTAATTALGAGATIEGLMHAAAMAAFTYVYTATNNDADVATTATTAGLAALASADYISEIAAFAFVTAYPLGGGGAPTTAILLNAVNNAVIGARVGGNPISNAETNAVAVAVAASNVPGAAADILIRAIATAVAAPPAFANVRAIITAINGAVFADIPTAIHGEINARIITATASLDVCIAGAALWEATRDAATAKRSTAAAAAPDLASVRSETQLYFKTLSKATHIAAINDISSFNRLCIATIDSHKYPNKYNILNNNFIESLSSILTNIEFRGIAAAFSASPAQPNAEIIRNAINAYARNIQAANAIMIAAAAVAAAAAAVAANPAVFELHRCAPLLGAINFGNVVNTIVAAAGANADELIHNIGQATGAFNTDIATYKNQYSAFMDALESALYNQALVGYTKDTANAAESIASTILHDAIYTYYNSVNVQNEILLNALKINKMGLPNAPVAAVGIARALNDIEPLTNLYINMENLYNMNSMELLSNKNHNVNKHHMLNNTLLDSLVNITIDPYFRELTINGNNPVTLHTTLGKVGHLDALATANTIETYITEIQAANAAIIAAIGAAVALAGVQSIINANAKIPVTDITANYAALDVANIAAARDANAVKVAINGATAAFRGNINTYKTESANFIDALEIILCDYTALNTTDPAATVALFTAIYAYYDSINLELANLMTALELAKNGNTARRVETAAQLAAGAAAAAAAAAGTVAATEASSIIAGNSFFHILYMDTKNAYDYISKNRKISSFNYNIKNNTFIDNIANILADIDFRDLQAAYNAAAAVNGHANEIITAIETYVAGIHNANTALFIIINGKAAVANNSYTNLIFIEQHITNGADFDTAINDMKSATINIGTVADRLILIATMGLNITTFYNSIKEYKNKITPFLDAIDTAMCDHAFTSHTDGNVIAVKDGITAYYNSINTELNTLLTAINTIEKLNTDEAKIIKTNVLISNLKMSIIGEINKAIPIKIGAAGDSTDYNHYFGIQYNKDMVIISNEIESIMRYNIAANVVVFNTTGDSTNTQFILINAVAAVDNLLSIDNNIFLNYSRKFNATADLIYLGKTTANDYIFTVNPPTYTELSENSLFYLCVLNILIVENKIRFVDTSAKIGTNINTYAPTHIISMAKSIVSGNQEITPYKVFTHLDVNIYEIDNSLYPYFRAVNIISPIITAGHPIDDAGRIPPIAANYADFLKKGDNHNYYHSVNDLAADQFTQSFQIDDITADGILRHSGANINILGKDRNIYQVLFYQPLLDFDDDAAAIHALSETEFGAGGHLNHNYRIHIGEPAVTTSYFGFYDVLSTRAPRAPTHHHKIKMMNTLSAKHIGGGQIDTHQHNIIYTFEPFHEYVAGADSTAVGFNAQMELFSGYILKKAVGEEKVPLLFYDEAGATVVAHTFITSSDAVDDLTTSIELYALCCSEYIDIAIRNRAINIAEQKIFILDSAAVALDTTAATPVPTHVKKYEHGTNNAFGNNGRSYYLYSNNNIGPGIIKQTMTTNTLAKLQIHSVAQVGGGAGLDVKLNKFLENIDCTAGNLINIATAPFLNTIKFRYNINAATIKAGVDAPDKTVAKTVNIRLGGNHYDTMIDNCYHVFNLAAVANINSIITSDNKRAFCQLNHRLGIIFRSDHLNTYSNFLNENLSSIEFLHEDMTDPPALNGEKTSIVGAITLRYKTNIATVYIEINLNDYLGCGCIGYYDKGGGANWHTTGGIVHYDAAHNINIFDDNANTRNFINAGTGDADAANFAVYDVSLMNTILDNNRPEQKVIFYTSAVAPLAVGYPALAAAYPAIDHTNCNAIIPLQSDKDNTPFEDTEFHYYFGRYDNNKYYLSERIGTYMIAARAATGINDGAFANLKNLRIDHLIKKYKIPNSPLLFKEYGLAIRIEDVRKIIKQYMVCEYLPAVHQLFVYGIIGDIEAAAANINAIPVTGAIAKLLSDMRIPVPRIEPYDKAKAVKYASVPYNDEITPKPAAITHELRINNYMGGNLSFFGEYQDALTIMTVDATSINSRIFRYSDNIEYNRIIKAAFMMHRPYQIYVPPGGDLAPLHPDPLKYVWISGELSINLDGLSPFSAFNGMNTLSVSTSPTPFHLTDVILYTTATEVLESDEARLRVAPSVKEPEPIKEPEPEPVYTADIHIQKQKALKEWISQLNMDSGKSHLVDTDGKTIPNDSNSRHNHPGATQVATIQIKEVEIVKSEREYKKIQDNYIKEVTLAKKHGKTIPKAKIYIIPSSKDWLRHQKNKKTYSLVDKNGNLDLSNIPNGKYIYNGAVIEF